MKAANYWTHKEQILIYCKLLLSVQFAAVDKSVLIELGKKHMKEATCPVMNNEYI